MINQLNLTVPYKSGTIAAVSADKRVVTVTPSTGTHTIPISAVPVTSATSDTDVGRYLVIRDGGNGRGQYYRIVSRSGNLYTLDRPADESTVLTQTDVVPSVGVNYSVSYDIEEFSDFAGVTGVYKTDEIVQIADMAISNGAAVHCRNDVLSIDPSKFQISGEGWFICGDELKVADGLDYKPLNACTIWLRQPSTGSGSDVNNQFRKHGTGEGSGRGQFGVAVFNGTTFLGDYAVNLQLNGHNADFNFSYTRLRSCTINRHVSMVLQGDPEPGRGNTFTAMIDMEIDAPLDRTNTITIHGEAPRFEYRDERPVSSIVSHIAGIVDMIGQNVSGDITTKINEIERNVTPKDDDIIIFRPESYDGGRIGFREPVEGEGGHGELVSGDRRVDDVDLPFDIQEIYYRGNAVYLRFPARQAIARDITGVGARVRDFQDVRLRLTIKEGDTTIGSHEYAFSVGTGNPMDNSIGWGGVPLAIQNHTVTADTRMEIDIINEVRTPISRRIEDIHNRVRDIENKQPEHQLYTNDDGAVRIVPIQEKAIRDRNL